MVKWEYRNRLDLSEIEMSELGRDGWELVGVSPYGKHSVICVFKRPIAEAQDVRYEVKPFAGEFDEMATISAADFNRVVAGLRCPECGAYAGTGKRCTCEQPDAGCVICGAINCDLSHE